MNNDLFFPSINRYLLRKGVISSLLALALLLPAQEVQAFRLRFRLPRIRLFGGRRRSNNDRNKEKDTSTNSKHRTGNSSSRASSSRSIPKSLNSKQRYALQRYRRPSKPDKLSQRELDLLVRHFSQRYGLDSRLVKAVVKVESNFNPHCLSEAGAMGLMQLMPDTARGLGVRDTWDPEENIEAGVRYLASMRKRFRDMTLALAAYNAGPGNVDKYKGVPPFKETQRYIKKVKQAFRQYQRAG